MHWWAHLYDQIWILSLIGIDNLLSISVSTTSLMLISAKADDSPIYSSSFS